MATGRSLLAALHSGGNETVIGETCEAAPTGPATVLKTACGLMNLAYLSDHIDRFDATMALEYGDSVPYTSWPPPEPQRNARFQAFDGYTREELETLVSTGNYPEI